MEVFRCGAGRWIGIMDVLASAGGEVGLVRCRDFLEKREEVGMDGSAGCWMGMWDVGKDGVQCACNLSCCLLF